MIGITNVWIFCQVDSTSKNTYDCQELSPHILRKGLNKRGGFNSREECEQRSLDWNKMTRVSRTCHTVTCEEIKLHAS